MRVSIDMSVNKMFPSACFLISMKDLNFYTLFESDFGNL